MCRGHLVQAPAQSWPRAMSVPVQTVSTDRNSTASPDNSFQCLIILMVETFSIMSNRNFPCPDTRLLPLTLSRCTSKKDKLAYTWASPTLKTRKCQEVLFLLLCCKNHPTVFTETIRGRNFFHRTPTSLQAQKTNHSLCGIKLSLAGSFLYWGKICLFCTPGWLVGRSWDFLLMPAHLPQITQYFVAWTTPLPPIH